MLKSIEVQGRTEDEAIELALEQLNLSRDDVSVEIIETAKTGLFGKKIPAVVKVEYDDPDAAEESEAPAEKSFDAKDLPSGTDGKAAARDGYKSGRGTSGVIDPELIDKISDYLTGLFDRMDMAVSFDISDKDGSVNVVLNSSDPGVLIGRRGETLDALQHLTNYSLNRSSASRVKIHLDAENYRKRRGEALENLAVRTAGKVVKYRRNLTLDPMNAYERHIIHAALQDFDQVSTFSVGNDANRRVVIAYGSDKSGQSRGSDSPQFKEWS